MKSKRLTERGQALILIAFGAIALFASGNANLGWLYIAILFINEVLLFVWKQ